MTTSVPKKKETVRIVSDSLNHTRREATSDRDARVKDARPCGQRKASLLVVERPTRAPPSLSDPRELLVAELKLFINLLISSLLASIVRGDRICRGVAPVGIAHGLSLRSSPGFLASHPGFATYLQSSSGRCSRSCHWGTVGCHAHLCPLIIIKLFLSTETTAP